MIMFIVRLFALLFNLKKLWNVLAVLFATSKIINIAKITLTGVNLAHRILDLLGYSHPDRRRLHIPDPAVPNPVPTHAPGQVSQWIWDRLRRRAVINKHPVAPDAKPTPIPQPVPTPAPQPVIPASPEGRRLIDRIRNIFKPRPPVAPPQPPQGTDEYKVW